ncbi:MAG TPA: MFS transporter [Solirubrobacteraceae bacterium]|nr:MFS transporter [Solirubrobacteraceae bacterium]
MTKPGTVGRSSKRPTVPMARVRMLTPLRNRNFALLWAGMTVSLLGDGIYFVAVIWETLRLSDTAMAVSLVGLAWTLPMVGFLLLGGTLSDRVERRRVLLWASLVQALAIGAIGILETTAAIQLWSLLLLVALYGAAQAFFLPAFEAVIPMLVSPDQLAEASALDQFVRPLSFQLVGPALGGVLIAVAGTGAAFLLDAGTFVVAVATLLVMRLPRNATAPAPGTLDGLRQGIRFVLANPWLWRTLLAASLTVLLFWGPYQVLLPFLVKNELHSGSATLGLIRALGGVGALLAALAVSQRGLPGWAMRAMLAGWALQSLTLAGYALAREAWLFAAISLAGGAFSALANVIWGTLMKTRVPNHLLGRVASLDWLVSIALVPLSFALTGPVAGLIGPRATLLGGGVLAAGTMITVMLMSGTRPSESPPQRRSVRTVAGAS